VYVTPKLDGVRAIIRQDGVWSRSMKPIPHKGVQELAKNSELWGLDGELILGSPTAPDVYRVTQSCVSRKDADSMPTFWAFDYLSADERMPYATRLRLVHSKVEMAFDERVAVVPAHLAQSAQELRVTEEAFLSAGYEGAILRAIDGHYKCGRSTVKEQGMLKLKRFVDGEAEILGVEEEMENTNPAEQSALGLTERSSAKAGLVGKNRMGALLVRDLKTGVEFKIGSGFTAEDREFFWEVGGPGCGLNPGSLVVKYKSFAIGVKDKPRFPIYLGMREGWDR
jgi:DNA ligase-1